MKTRLGLVVISSIVLTGCEGQNISARVSHQIAADPKQPHDNKTRSSIAIKYSLLGGTLFRFMHIYSCDPDRRRRIPLSSLAGICLDKLIQRLANAVLLR